MFIEEGNYMIVKDYAKKESVAAETIHQRMRAGKLEYIKIKGEDTKNLLTLVKLSTD